MIIEYKYDKLKNVVNQRNNEKSLLRKGHFTECLQMEAQVSDLQWILNFSYFFKCEYTLKGVHFACTLMLVKYSSRNTSRRF